MHNWYDMFINTGKISVQFILCVDICFLQHPHSGWKRLVLLQPSCKLQVRVSMVRTCHTLQRCCLKLTAHCQESKANCALERLKEDCNQRNWDWTSKNLNLQYINVYNMSNLTQAATTWTQKSFQRNLEPGTCWINSVFIGNDLPELGTNLVATLASAKDEMWRCQWETAFLASSSGSLCIQFCHIHIWPPWTCTSSRMASGSGKRKAQNSRALEGSKSGDVNLIAK